MRVALLIGLSVLGLAYNAGIDALTRRRVHLAGLTAVQVCAGVAYTLPAAAWLMGERPGYLRRLGWLLAAFAAAGAPMLAGDIFRDWRAK